jgi:hypothetical protein
MRSRKPFIRRRRVTCRRIPRVIHQTPVCHHEVLIAIRPFGPTRHQIETRMNQRRLIAGFGTLLVSLNRDVRGAFQRRGSRCSMFAGQVFGEALRDLLVGAAVRAAVMMTEQAN